MRRQLGAAENLAANCAVTEFRAFIEHTEKELRQLFESIDRDHNGQLDKSELQAAFRRAHLVIPNSKLDKFFEEVDTNHDGVISFDEWRSMTPRSTECC